MLRPLTSFRFLAVACVFTWHANFLLKYQLGYAGVSFFFVLSGFLLTYHYRGYFNHLTRERVSSFYLARFAKIYPVHVLMFVALLPTIMIVFHVKFTQLVIPAVTNLLLLQSFIPSRNYYFSINSVSWSLSDEVFFYLLMPMLLALLAKLRSVFSVRRLLVLLLISWILMSIVLSSQHGTMDEWALYVFPPIRLFDFITGVLLCELSVLLGTARWSLVRWSLFEFGTMLLVVTTIEVSPWLPESLRFSALYMPAWGLLILIFSRQMGIFSTIFSHRTLEFLGQTSFSFYMIHYIVIKLFYTDRMATLVGGGVHEHIKMMSLAFVVSTVLSGALFLLYEEPVRKRIRCAYVARNGPRIAERVEG